MILLQNLHPNARVIYSSATGASEPYHLSYMTRLGLWGPDKKYASCGELMDSLEKRYYSLNLHNFLQNKNFAV